MSHEAVYTRVLWPRDKENWPVTGVMLRSKRTRCRPRSPVGQRTHPVRGDGQHWLTAPEDVDDRRAPGALGG